MHQLIFPIFCLPNGKIIFYDNDLYTGNNGNIKQLVKGNIKMPGIIDFSTMNPAPSNKNMKVKTIYTFHSSKYNIVIGTINITTSQQGNQDFNMFFSTTKDDYGSAGTNFGEFCSEYLPRCIFMFDFNKCLGFSYCNYGDVYSLWDNDYYSIKDIIYLNLTSQINQDEAHIYQYDINITYFT